MRYYHHFMRTELVINFEFASVYHQSLSHDPYQHYFLFSAVLADSKQLFIKNMRKEVIPRKFSYNIM